MITEDYVSFEVAKLLKEKGFNEICHSVYDDEVLCSVASLNRHYECDYGDLVIVYRNTDYNDWENKIAAPTIQRAIKWIEEVHHILVVPDYIYECTPESWSYKIYRLGENGKPERCVVKGVSYDDDNNPTEHIVGYRDYELSYKDYATREEAEEEGIRYVLENLI